VKIICNKKRSDEKYVLKINTALKSILKEARRIDKV